MGTEPSSKSARKKTTSPAMSATRERRLKKKRAAEKAEAERRRLAAEALELKVGDNWVIPSAPFPSPSEVYSCR